MNNMSKENTCWLSRLLRRIYVWLFNTVEVGQIWQLDINDDDPFKKKHYLRYEIIETSGAYCKYSLTSSSGNNPDIDSNLKSWVKAGAKRIK